MSPFATLPVPSEAAELLRLHRLAQERRGLLPNSVDHREIKLKCFARWLDPRGLFDATRQDVELFLDGRRTREGRKIVSRTRRLWLNHLHAFYKWAMAEELTATDPTERIIRPRHVASCPAPSTQTTW